MDISMFREERPVEPAGFVILTIGIIVPALCASHFATHDYHGHTHREHGDGQKVLHLPVSELLHRGVIGGTFNAAVPAAVVVGAVTVVFAVCFVVLVVIRDEVVQGEAVMTGHKVHTLLNLAFFLPVNGRAPKQTVGKASYRPFLPTQKAPHIVPEPSVPLLPTIPDE